MRFNAYRAVRHRLAGRLESDQTLTGGFGPTARRGQ